MEAKIDRSKSAEGVHFYPDYLFEVLLVVLVTVEFVVGLAFLFPPSVGRPLDLAGQYDPRPEWYFLWLYELIRYFPGQTAVIGAVILPLGFILGLGLLPFVDRFGDRRGPYLALALMGGVLGGWVGLTLMALWRS